MLSSWSQKKSFQSVFTEYNVCCGFFIYNLSYVKVVFTMRTGLSVIIIKGYWICLMLFLHPWRLSYICFSFMLSLWFITLIGFHMLNLSCIPGINPTWTYFNMLLNSVFLGIWQQWSLRILPCSFIFLVLSLSGIRRTLDS